MDFIIDDAMTWQNCSNEGMGPKAGLEHNPYPYLKSSQKYFPCFVTRAPVKQNT
jgi:hypothetical protein